MQPSGTPFLRILLLWIAGLCAAAQFAKISVIFPALREVYPDAGAELGFLVSLLSFVGILLGLVAGLAAARTGFRRLLLIALSGGALISLYQATLPPLPLMLLSRAVEGFSHLVIVVVAPTLIIALAEKRHHPPVMTLWSTFFGVAFALTAWLGGPLAEAHGPAALFLAHAAVLLIVAMLLFLLLPREQIAAPGAERLSFATMIRRHAEIYTSPFVSAPATGWLFYTLTYVSLLTLLPDYVPPEARTFVAGAMPLASIAAAIISGATLLRWFRAVPVAIAGFALGAAISLLFFMFPGSPLLCISIFVALGLVQGASFTAIPELNSEAEARALANGAMAQMGNLGNTLGTPLILALVGAGGFGALAGFVALMHFGGAFTHFALARRRRGKFLP